MPTFADLHTELHNTPGLGGLPSGQRTFLLNEGMRELAVRSEWTRATRNLGPTVIDQAAYDLDTDIYRIIELSVDSKPWASGDVETVQNVIAGQARMRARGIFYTTFGSDGTEQISLYRPPDAAGLDILAVVVYTPADLEEGSDEPPLPAQFHRAIVDYAASQALTDPQDQERKDEHTTRFEVAVERLMGLRNSRQSRGPVLMGISGIHF